MKTQPTTLILKPQPSYELIDSGEGEKLERFGEYVLRRPDPQALWLKSAPGEWDKADAIYGTEAQTGLWKGAELPESWELEFGGIRLNIKASSFKHTGLFPEQLSNWEWLREVISGKLEVDSKREIKVLNLFGYTGGASVVCSRAGASVTHVDSSRSAIGWAKSNAESNNISNIRWILEDAFEFVQKELRRGNTYDGIIMDPPSFGHGTKGEIWKIEKQFVDLVEDCKTLLSPNPSFMLMSGYAAGYSAITYGNNLQSLVGKYRGTVECGELAIRESVSGRLLPTGIFARFLA